MIVFRPSARALITDPDGRVLLLRVRDAVALDASDPVTDYWVTVGGGVEPGETFETAVVREIFGETGHVVDDAGPCIWRRRNSVTDAASVTRASDEWYFWCSVPSSALSQDNLIPSERTYFQKYRWWDIDDPTLPTIRVFPADFDPAARSVLLHGRPPIPRWLRQQVDLDMQRVRVRIGDDEILVSWHPPDLPPDGQRHGAEGICVTDSGEVVLVSRDGQRWEFPAGRPEGDETWEQTLRREVREEACATVVRSRLLGFSRGQYIAGRQAGCVLVRSLWRADVVLDPWRPRHEIPFRGWWQRPTSPVSSTSRGIPFAPIVRRAIREARI